MSDVWLYICLTFGFQDLKTQLVSDQDETDTNILLSRLEFPSHIYSLKLSLKGQENIEQDITAITSVSCVVTLLFDKKLSKLEFPTNNNSTIKQDTSAVPLSDVWM